MRSLTAIQLRRELSSRNAELARNHEHELTFSESPSYIYQQNGATHGNFHPLSFHAISGNELWRARLEKGYTAARFVPRRWDRSRKELDCCNSSDALLMNVFCYPGALSRPSLRLFLGLIDAAEPTFGVKPRIPLKRGRGDQTEVDMVLGSLLVEAKLTESDFQRAPLAKLLQYRDFETVFNLDELPRSGETFHSYQLIRGVLAAFCTEGSFALLCDARRVDLIEKWVRIIRAVKLFELRHRLGVFTWQELADHLPESLTSFLGQKYGIFPEHRQNQHRREEWMLAENLTYSF